MAEQERRRVEREDPEVPDAPTPPPAQNQARDTEVDALLDEIDDVLESNAETFVRGFVQKGGE